jgi:outer membrane receptor protein involved in Fe transport
MRIHSLILTGALICGAMALAQAAMAESIEMHRFDIKAQPLASALLEFSKQADRQVVGATEALREVRTTGVTGELSVGDALGKLLEGTGLQYELVGEHSVRIVSEGSRAAYDGTPGVTRVAQGEGNSSVYGAAGAGQSSEETAKSASSAESSEGVKLEEIVVTAQKRKQQTIEVPMSITAFSGEKLAAAGIDSALDLSFAVPSLSVSETQPGRQMIMIRGVGSERGSSALTGVYLDEMSVTGARGGGGLAVVGTDLRVIDLARVEVLKGPQGTLFGEGAAGGVVRFITNDADLSRLGGDISTEFSNTSDGGWNEQITGVLNLPLVEDVFGIRVAAQYQNDSGWIDTPAGLSGPSGPPSIGREDINDTEIAHLRVKALFAPTPSLRIGAMAEIHRNDGGASNIVNLEPRRHSDFISGVDRNGPTNYTDDYDAYNLTVTYDLGFADFLSSTSHLQFDSLTGFTQVFNDGPVTEADVAAGLLLEIEGRGRNEATIDEQEFRLTSATSGPFNWTIGASYKDNEFASIASTDASLFGGALILTDLGAGVIATQTSESWATFGEVSYEFADRLEIGGGLRYFSDTRESYDAGAATPDVLSDDFEKLTYRAYIRYQATDDANLYLNVATGFRSGGFNNPNTGALGGPPSYGTEETLFYELGAKTALFDERVRFDVALFLGQYDGMQEDSLIDSPVDGSPLQFTTNSQDAEIRGVEWNIDWRAMDQLTLGLAGDVTNAEITWIDPTNQAPAFAVGDHVNFVPKYSLSANADYRFDWSPSVPGFFLLSYNRKGKQYIADRSNFLIGDNPGNSAPEISFLNVSVGGEWNGWNLSLFGRNLLDEYRAINAAQTGWTAQARPRTVGITIGKNF